jgi:hypothetical protein
MINKDWDEDKLLVDEDMKYKENETNRANPDEDDHKPDEDMKEIENVTNNNKPDNDTNDGKMLTKLWKTNKMRPTKMRLTKMSLL